MQLTPALPALLAVACCAQAQTDTAASALSEKDFMADVPIVLSVSRLAQRLDETPGAMTILDREFIRMSGARDVVDVLRFVPGFQTTRSFEEDAPLATYHGRSEAFANRIQVLVDGRSVYSGFLQGSAGIGWQTLSLDDIERIEVLRGSNSAAYGARAFLGVVNIVSRDVRDTQGVDARLAGGDNQVADAQARVGWGDGTLHQRISVDTRGDAGLRKVFTGGKYARGDNRVSRVNYSAHKNLGAAGDMDFRAGAVEVQGYRGELGPGSEGNRERLRFLGAHYAQLNWRRALGENEDIEFALSRTGMFNRDAYPYLPALGHPFYAYYGTTIESSAREINDAASVQYTARVNPILRWVGGAEFRQEYLYSPSSLDTIGSVSSHFRRVFANAEVKPGAHLLLNLGGLYESSDIGGDISAPRAMLNWHPVPGHVLRAGASTAFRTPSAFEKYARVRYYQADGSNPTGYFDLGNEGVQPERVFSRELGYAFMPDQGALSLDLRAYMETILDGIGVNLSLPRRATNGDSYTIAGMELQLRWSLGRSDTLMLAYSGNDITIHQLAVDDANVRLRTTYGAPKTASSLLWIHDWGNSWSTGLSYQSADRFALTSDNSNLYSMARTDIHLRQRLQWARQRGEWGLTVQNLNVPFADGDKKFFFDQRAFVTLRLEY
ncbi:MAG: TonB-dependent receptor plug domain-containing protein [Rhodoferax sp.]